MTTKPPRARTASVRISYSLLMDAKIAAIRQGLSLAAWLDAAVLAELWRQAEQRRRDQGA